MTDNLPSSKTVSATDQKATPNSAPRKRRNKVALPSVDEILQQLIQLNGAVAIGAMSSRDASLIHKNLSTVLEVQMKRANREDSGPSQEALSELCRNDPRVLNAIEPFLTDTQVEWLMAEVTDDSDDEV